MEHIIYGALKRHYRSSVIEQGEWGLVLRTGSPLTESPLAEIQALESHGDRETAGGAEKIIPLDRNGAVLFEIPHGGEDFRRTEFGKFLEYDDADRSLRRLLGDALSLGIYDHLEGEKNPVFLYDYALSLKEDLLASPPGTDKSRWVEARLRYFDSLDEFLYGPSEMGLIRGYEDLIAMEELSDQGIAKLIALRDATIEGFAKIREQYAETMEKRNSLESVLAGSFCIMGPLATRPGDTEASALLANSLLTGRVIDPGRDPGLLLGALACALLTCLCIKGRGPVMTLGLGLPLSFLSGAGFAATFVFSGLWLDPLIPAAAAAAGTLISFMWALGARRGFNRRFRLAYGPFVAKPCLKSLIWTGSPLPSQTLTARTVAVAIRDPLLVTREDREPCLAGAGALLAFQNEAADIFKKAGAVITGCEEDMVLASFGSPLDRTAGVALSAARAAGCIAGILKTPECSSWRFGLDAGECAFTWSALSGYSAFGRPMVRARILSTLASRYKVRAAASAAVSEALPDILARRLDVLKGKDGSGGAAFYELKIEGR
jgi:class 3 adenylate cyclase